MKHYGMTAREAIAWFRICRPGSVLGAQQHYLDSIQEAMWDQGRAMRAAAAARRRPKSSLPQLSPKAAAARIAPATLSALDKGAPGRATTMEKTARRAAGSGAGAGAGVAAGVGAGAGAGTSSSVASP